MKTLRFAVLAAVAGLTALAAAQSGNNTGDPLDPQPNGPRQSDPTWHFFVGPTVHVSPDETIQTAILEIRDGRIVSVADMTTVRFAPPPGAQVHDASSFHVYPGFIDAHLPIEVERPSIDAPGAHWNGSVTPQRTALDAEGVPTGDAKRLRALGFTTAAIAPKGGIFAGRAAVVSLAEIPADAAMGRPPVYREDVYQAASFQRAGPNRGEFTSYPNSQMGAIALLRQTLIDADWEAQHADQSRVSALTYLAPTLGTPLLFRTRDELEGLRAFKIAREFQRVPLILGSGTEFRRLDAIPVGPETNTGLRPAYILPLTFPETPEIDTIGKADSTDLRTLMTWEQAPTNPRRLDEIGVDVALTASGLRKGEKFDTNLRESITRGGLAPERALAMLTTNPAALLGVAESMGTIETGKIANLVVTTGDLFDAKQNDTEILDVWIDGKPHTINPPPPPFDGTWTLRVGDFFEMKLVIEGASVTGIEGTGDDAYEGPARKVSITGNAISFLIDDTDDGSGTYVISGILAPDGTIRGTGLGPDNSPFEWTATRDDPEPNNQQDAGAEKPETPEDDKPEADLPPEDLPGYPFGPYAIKELPAQQTVIFHNATIWTSGPEGVIENGWLCIEDGKIIALGSGAIDVVTQHEPMTIDLEGRHLTPGLIDAHSHTGISRGINESGQAVTAEVRVGDVTNPDAINWYRQLAGGVTTVNNMHGSANPIGGQTQTNKVRWGAVHPDDMHLQGAKPGIKFALGENVKQSNWQSPRTRYPQSRMGVETLIRDRFFAAKEYARANNPRRDLELEALAEILAGERLVHCHSYRQDEILMLCRVAEDFGFKIGTFQHGLEVYKVAEAVRDNAIGASLFSDWWAYKVEVQDAIAQAGPLQTEVGVLTSYNSDSDELARRMHVEAAKAYKYSDGRLSKEDALKFVTINPAIQLGIDNRIGSIEVGKDADLAIWSGDPLSSFSMCEATWIDGREYFSIERDAQLRAQNAEHRSRITQKILTKGAPKPESKQTEDEDNATEDDPPRSLRERLAAAARTQHNLDLFLRGINPADHRCGDCGNAQVHLGANQ